MPRRWRDQTRRLHFTAEYALLKHLVSGLQGAKDDAAPQYLVDDERKYPSRESLGPLCELLLGCVLSCLSRMQ